MYSVDTCEYIFLACLDVGFLLKDEDRKNEEASRKALVGYFQHKELSTFTAGHPEGGSLTTIVKKAASEGGKQIFTGEFLKNHAPTVFDDENPPALLFQGSDPGPEIALGAKFTVLGTQWRYKSAKLRAFRNGSLGIELRFRWDESPNRQNCEQLVAEIRQLEHNLAEPAAYYKLKHVIESCGESMWRFPGIDDFFRLASRHRVKILGSLHRDGISLDFDELIGDREALRSVSGILNRAEWFSNYCDQYVNELKEKFIAYQRDEFFITDRNSSLILFPQFYSDQLHKKQFVENVVFGAHFLLSWEAFGRYIGSSLASYNNSQDAAGLDPTLEELTRDISESHEKLASLKDALAVGAMVDHGFTTRVLTQFLRERDLSARVDAISRKLETKTRKKELTSTIVRQERLGTRSRTLQIIAISIALIALCLSALFQYLNYNLNKSRARATVGATTKPDRIAAPPESEKSMPLETGPQPSGK